MTTYDRPVTGADVIGVVRLTATSAEVRERIRRAIPVDLVIPDIETLRQRMPAETVGLTPGAYASLFGPLFGEFE
ncbi:MAG: hypothetical protein R2878_02295 [Thermoleophilia bacterium]